MQFANLLPLLKVRSIHALFVTLLVVLQYWFQLMGVFSGRPGILVALFAGLFQHNVASYVVGFAIITVLQQFMAPGGKRVLVMIAALLTWVALVSLSATWMFLRSFIVVELGLVSPAGIATDGMWTQSVYLGLAVWYYESADRAQRSTAALRAAEFARQSAERWLLELRLSSLQARLDPRVLFDTLDEAGRLYRSAPAAAEALLDALIDYLRRALPQLRQPESTLGREIELAVAYARVLRSPDGRALELESAIAGAATDARFPPMVVQPLCDALARSVLDSGTSGRLAVSAERTETGVVLGLTVKPACAAVGDGRLAEVRRTLLSMFAPLVRIEAIALLDRTGLLVEVPYVPAVRADR